LSDGGSVQAIRVCSCWQQGALQGTLQAPAAGVPPGSTVQYSTVQYSAVQYSAPGPQRHLAVKLAGRRSAARMAHLDAGAQVPHVVGAACGDVHRLQLVLLKVPQVHTLLLQVLPVLGLRGRGGEGEGGRV
jgi:hypothetical protein